jgi:uncharacterized GH25 family protein
MLVVLLCCSAPALAHDFWMEASSFRPAVGSVVTIGLRVGQDLIGDPVSRDSQLIERFVVRDGASERNLGGIEGQDPAGYVSIERPGTALVAYRSRPKSLELAADKFEDYLRQEGLERIIAIRASRGESKQSSKEIFSRCAKALLVTAGAQPRGFDRPIGLRLEIVPESDPINASTLRARLLYEGQPLEGALVIALHPPARFSARTDRQGRVTLPIDARGVWLIKAVHMIPAATESGAQWESLWASFTFER